MANKRKNWTLQEENVLKECIAKSSTLVDAFRMASEKLGRPEKSIQNHYYYNKKHVLTLYSKTPLHTSHVSVFSRLITTVKRVFLIH